MTAKNKPSFWTDLSESEQATFNEFEAALEDFFRFDAKGIRSKKVADRYEKARAALLAIPSFADIDS